jgi:hypothetical protein
LARSFDETLHLTARLLASNLMGAKDWHMACLPHIGMVEKWERR